MSQAISALPKGSIVNIAETISGITKLIPYIIIATGEYDPLTYEGNPYGSDKVLILRKNISERIAYHTSSITKYENSNIDVFCCKTIYNRYNSFFKSCIATSNVISNEINGADYTMSRKVFILSVSEVFGSTVFDNSLKINYFQNNSHAAYNEENIMYNFWLRTLYLSDSPGIVVSSSTAANATSKITSYIGVRSCMNIYANTQVSSIENESGGYNILPPLKCLTGAGNSGIDKASDVEIDSAVFTLKYPENGSYTFICDGSSWFFKESSVNLAECGITLLKVPKSGDTITVILSTVNRRVEFDCLLKESLLRPHSARVSVEINGGDKQTLLLCNNYLDASPSWESATPGYPHTFTNTVKNSENWALGGKLTVEGENSITVKELHGVMLADEA